MQAPSPPPATRRPPPAARRTPPAARRPPSTVHPPPLTARCPPPTIGKDASAQEAEENDGLDEPMIQNGVNFASAGDAVHTIFSFMFILTPLLIGFVRCEVLVGQGGLSLFEVIMLCFVIASPIGGTYSTLSVVFRTWMLAMTLSISRRCEHLELLGEEGFRVTVRVSTSPHPNGHPFYRP